MKKRMLTALCVLAFLLNSAVVFSAENTEPSAKEENSGSVAAVSESDLQSYHSYLSQNTAFEYADSDIILSAADFRCTDGTAPAVCAYGDKENVVRLERKGESLTCSFTVEKAGNYCLSFSYCPLPGREMPVSISATLDGNICFEEMNELSFPRIWKNSGTIRTDGDGNEFAPEQIEANEFTERLAADSTGVVKSPYLFALTSGVHTIKITVGSEPFVFEKLSFVTPEAPLSYAETVAVYEQEGYSSADAEPIVIEGESALRKTTRSIIPLSTNGTCDVSPSDPFKSRINYIGSTNWKSPGETLVWDFSVEESGLYKIGFRYSQIGVENGDSYRWLKLDGKTPFAEARNIAFHYDTSWRYFELGEEEPYCVYLEAGRHTLSLEVTLGDMAEYIGRLEAVVSEIGNLYLKINMITGESVDPNRNYDLFDQIPGFMETLEKNRDLLNTLASDIENGSGMKGSPFVSAIRDMSAVLDRMFRNPYTAQQYKSDYYSKYCTLTSWRNDIKEQPLSLDQIVFVPAELEMKNMSNGFFAKLAFSVKRFVFSFVEDYREKHINESDGGITIWVNWGRDQAQVLESLIKETFTPNTGIAVNLKIVNATVVQAILSGNGPDCCLQMNRTEPVNLAMRGALYDLKQFDDYDEVLTRFANGAETPYIFEDGCYALPDTQNFNMLFYRTDIFESLGIAPPRSWEEFKEVSAEIERNNLQVSIPYIQISDTTTVCSGVGSLSLFPTLLIQHGISLYNESLSATTLTDSETLNVFNMWTDFYTEMKFPIQSDFYNRFRIGLMPMGIAGYTTYALLKVAAPEIAGRWAMTEIPGVLGEDGSVNNSEAGFGTGCAVLELSEHKQEAWEFLKWWTCTDTQLRYSNNVESVLGVAGRVPTSNIEAFKLLSWTDEDLEKLLSQWEKVIEIPEVPGSYYTSRAIDQAYWNTVDQGKYPKDTMIKWGKKADEEIARKRSEYNVK